MRKNERRFFRRRLQDRLAESRERKRVVSALRASEARLREAQALSHIGSWELDFKTNTLVWSDEVYAIFELDKPNFRASYDAFLAMIHPDDRTLVDAAFKRSVELREPYAIDHRLLMPDSRIKYVHERGVTHYDERGHPQRSVGTVQDVTERRLAEQPLAEKTEDRFRRLLESAPDAMVIVDRQGRIVLVNAQADRLFGYPRDELIGQPIEILVPTQHAQAHQHDRSHYQQHPTQRAMGKLRDLSARRRDGSEFPVDISLGPLDTEDGALICAAVRDITERRRAEETLQRLRA